MGLETVFLIAILVMSVVIHEVAHGAVADFLGDPTARLAGRLTLNPISHLDLFGSIILPLLMFLLPGGLVFGWAKPVPYNPYNLRGGKWGPALVAAAGPGVNLLLALIFGLLARSGLIVNQSFLAGAGLIVLMNISLAIFNLVPIPPLDGSKILSAVLPYNFRGVENFLHVYWPMLIFFLIFFVWGVLSRIILWLAFLIIGAPTYTAVISHFF